MAASAQAQVNLQLLGRAKRPNLCTTSGALPLNLLTLLTHPLSKNILLSRVPHTQGSVRGRGAKGLNGQVAVCSPQQTR